MRFKIALFLIFLMLLSVHALATPRQYADSANVLINFPGPNPNLQNDNLNRIEAIVSGNCCANVLHWTWIAENEQLSPEDLEQQKENLAEMKHQLEQRRQALDEEWKTLQVEQQELARISRGGTLRGSKKNRFMKRSAEFNERVMKYNEDKDQLQRDYDTYNASINQKE